MSAILLGVAVVVLFSGVPAFTSHAAVDKGVLREVTFIFRPHPGDFAKPGHGRPVAACAPTTNANVSDWGPTGWHMPDAGLTYRVNTSTIPANLTTSAFLDAISDSTGTWTQADNAQQWAYGGTASAKSAKYDGINLVSFGGASGGIAVTKTWYWTDTGEVAESDMIFSSSLPWSISSGDECAGVAGTYDVKNIATHEFGHQVGLIDLYASADKDLTMYGYGTMGELKKTSLGLGDNLGVDAVAP